MNVYKKFKHLLFSFVVILAVFVAASVIDIWLFARYQRSYTSITFLVLFAVVGIIAGVICYFTSTEKMEDKTEFKRWSTIIFLIGISLLLFFLVARLEGGEYEGAFKA